MAGADRAARCFGRLCDHRRRRANLHRGLLLQLLLYAAVVTLRYVSLPLPETAQGRHLYPALSSIAILAVAGGYLLPRRRRVAATVVLTGDLLGLTLIAPTCFFLPPIPYLPLTATDSVELPLRRDSARVQVDPALPAPGPVELGQLEVTRLGQRPARLTFGWTVSACRQTPSNWGQLNSNKRRWG